MSEEGETKVLSWKTEHWSLVGPTWPGFNEIKYLIIFGDSYSQTSIFPQGQPTEEEPLGVPFPGDTYTEGPANWVGHLVKERKLLVHNYAQGGATVSGVRTQIIRNFLNVHPPAIPWKANDTLFVTWVGINDLAYNPDVDVTINALFKLQEELYDQGARNFLFCDVPCVDRSPAYIQMGIEGAETRFHDWNLALDNAIRTFVAEKSTKNDPITAIYFSSHKVFSALLDHPDEYGFPQKDTQKAGGSIWMDHLHPTSAVHLIVAMELHVMLSSIPQSAPPEGLKEGKHETT